MSDQFMTQELLDILYHTVHRAANGHYCGGGDSMKKLVGAGLMESHGDFLGNSYFGITDLGRRIMVMKQFQYLKK
jgi:hypothetical protein